MRHTNKGKLSLDVGCGFIDTVHQKRGVIGVDIVKSRMSDVQADGETLPFRDNVFEKVVFRASLEHFNNPLQGMREALRVSKPDAIFHFIIPKDARHWKRDFRLLFIEFPFGIPNLIKIKLQDTKYRKTPGYFHKNRISSKDIARFFDILQCKLIGSSFMFTYGRKGRFIQKIGNVPKLGAYQKYHIIAKRKS